MSKMLEWLSLLFVGAASFVFFFIITIYVMAVFNIQPILP